jgi:hypothetical protein
VRTLSRLAATGLLALAGCTQKAAPPPPFPSAAQLDPHADADFQVAANGCVGHPSLAAAQALALALHATAVTPVPVTEKTYTQPDPGQPTRYLRMDITALTLHQWNLSSGDQVRYREETIRPAEIDNKSGQVVGTLMNETQRACTLSIDVANAADHLDTVHGLVGGPYAVLLSSSLPSIQFAADPLFQAGIGVSFAFQGQSLGQGLPMDGRNFAVRISDGGSDVQQPVAGTGLTEITMTQQQLRTALSRQSTMVLLSVVEG